MKKAISLLFVVTFIYFLFVYFFTVDSVYAAETFPFNGIIHADSLVIYETNNSGGAKATELAYGTRVQVTKSISNAKSTGCSLYEISYEGGRIGYACSSYITNVDSNTLTIDFSGIETYRQYCDSLIQQGFGESYCPYLYYLHAKHPKWIFKPDINSDSLDYASSKEEWKVVLQTSNPNYLLSSSPAESNYYYIKSNVIASYMDPRNGLFENTIFQFLDFVSSRYTYNTAAMSKMAGNGNLKNYLNTYEQAGSTYGVNPLHLLARSKQEGANDASYNSVNGQYTSKMSIAYNNQTLDGFYNYYNINATPGNGLGAIGNGLAYAAGYVLDSKESDGSLTYLRPWNTPEKAILGGAKFISTSYVNKGQNTNYFEKFNIASYSSTSKYSHQYMTNIYAPASESVSIFNAYNISGLMDSEFVFIIPVFKDMQESIYQPENKSSDNYLTTLQVDTIPIVGFSKDVNEYIVTSPTTNNYVDISAISSSNKASITGSGRIYFIDGIARTSVVVVAENGASNAYFLTVKQAISSTTPTVNVSVDSIVSKIDAKINNGIMYAIVPGTAVSTLINTVVNNGGSAVIKDKNGTDKVSGSLDTGDKITISGTNESKTYIISVRGDTNGDGAITVLDLLRCQKHILKSITLSGEQFYAADVNYDGAITVLDLLKIQKHILGSASL